MAVVQEALSNVARHVGATKVEVMVEAGAEAVTVRVSDNWPGPPDGPGSGHGLANMAIASPGVSGAASASARPLGGTLVEWQVEAR